MYIIKREHDGKIGYLKGEEGWVWYPKQGPIDPSGSTMFTYAEASKIAVRGELPRGCVFQWYGAYQSLKELKNG